MAPKKPAAAAPAKQPAKAAAPAKTGASKAKPAVKDANQGRSFTITQYESLILRLANFYFLCFLFEAKKLVQKGKHLKRTRRIHTTVRFRRPNTLSLPRTPRYKRKSVPHRNRFV